MHGIVRVRTEARRIIDSGRSVRVLVGDAVTVRPQLEALGAAGRSARRAMDGGSVTLDEIAGDVPLRLASQA